MRRTYFRRLLIVVFAVSIFSSQGHAVLGGPDQKNGQDITPFLLNFFLIRAGYDLSDLGFQWLEYQFGWSEEGTPEVELPEDEKAVAQLAFNELLQSHQSVKLNMDGLRARLKALPVAKLFKIISGKVRPEVGFLAEHIVRTQHVLPLLAQGQYDQVGDLNTLFRRTVGRARPEMRDTAANLFRFSHPNPEVELKEPTVHQFLRINAGHNTPAQVLRNWSRGSSFVARKKAVLNHDVGQDDILQDLQLQVLELEGQLREHKEPNDALFKIVHEIHTAILFFESIVFGAQNDSENETPQPQAKAKKMANDQVKKALGTKGEDRFPISGKLEDDALFLGFVQDPALISEAAMRDASDKKHTIKKGGGESYIRGSLIVSRDRDSHAGGAYKIHHESRGVWKYVDTAILLEVGNQMMFLCLNRGTKHKSHYWRLVDAEGQWYQLRSDIPNAVPEPINGPDVVGAEANSLAS